MAKGMHKPKSLKKRQAAYANHGKNPASNPGKNAMDMHRPGSNKK